MPVSSKSSYITEIKQIIKEARAKAYRAVNYTMVEAYWLIGRRIVEEIQNGEHRANYGEQVIKSVSKALTAEFGRGFSERSVWQYRQFFQMFPKFPIRRSMLALSDKPSANSAITDRRILKSTAHKTDENLLYPLGWTHIQRLMRVTDQKARAWYLREAADQSWDVRTLDRNITTQYYERLLLSQVKKPDIIKEMKTKTGKFQRNKLEFIKNPSVLEFLGLPGNTGCSEAAVEAAIINHLQQFIFQLDGTD